MDTDNVHIHTDTLYLNCKKDNPSFQQEIFQDMWVV